MQAIPTPSVHTGIREDVYLPLVRIEEGLAQSPSMPTGSPLMWLLWLGGLVVVGGGGLSFVGRRTRQRTVLLVETADV